jgi:hypothetical protein
MKLYDFSIFAERRKERQAAAAVAEVVEHLDQPGSVIELKQRVHHWLNLHSQVLHKAANS